LALDRRGRVVNRDPGFVPDRGDIVWLDHDPQAGHEQRGRRPALILSPSRYNGRVGLALCCPLTTRVKHYPFEVAVPRGLAVEGVILADQVRSLDWRSRNASLLGRVPEETVQETLAKLLTLLQ
jgi:mRNA interferase MazF